MLLSLLSEAIGESKRFASQSVWYLCCPCDESDICVLKRSSSRQRWPILVDQPATIGQLCSPLQRVSESWLRWFNFCHLLFSASRPFLHEYICKAVCVCFWRKSDVGRRGAGRRGGFVSGSSARWWHRKLMKKQQIKRGRGCGEAKMVHNTSRKGYTKTWRVIARRSAFLRLTASPLISSQVDTETCI